MNTQDPNSLNQEENLNPNLPSPVSPSDSSEKEADKSSSLEDSSTDEKKSSEISAQDQPLDVAKEENSDAVIEEQEHAESIHTQKPFEIPEEKVLSEIDLEKEEILTEKVSEPSGSDTQTELMQNEGKEEAESIHTQKPFEIPEEKVLSEIDPEKADEGAAAKSEKPKEKQISTPKEKSKPKTIEQLLSDMESLINLPDAGSKQKEFYQLRDLVQDKISERQSEAKTAFLAENESESDFHYEHPLQARFSALQNIFKEKHALHLKEQEEQYAENLEKRQAIIERLKSLYSDTEPGTNLFAEIRAIKKEWSEAGQVARSEFKLLYNNYFHHLNQFYQMLDLNKEYLEQEYAHNLETRKHIIQRTKELLNEPVQKALNELQYLHKLWKEEGEPVAEEFRESTWNEFKELSNQVHDRRSELHKELQEIHAKNLARKRELIEKIKEITLQSKDATHKDYQKVIGKVENWRSEFLKIGSVPKEFVNPLWDEFKTVLREFNHGKNKYYKSIKETQHENLQKKLDIIQIAKDNMLSEDWDTMVPLFKKLQSDWKTIGFVPRAASEKTWIEFKDACNTFFNNFRSKSAVAGDDWNKNFIQKKKLLEELKEINDSSGSVEALEALKSKWNSIGKIPKDKLHLNSEFNKVFREKLKMNHITEYDLKDENLSESQLTDKARKLKNQIVDLESEIATLENNLGFFQSASRDNPLLKDTYEKIDSKHALLVQLKASLHQIISGE